MRLIAASTAGAPAADPASTTTTPSSPTCTPMFAPAPAMTKNEGRTSRISRPFDGAAVRPAAPRRSEARGFDAAARVAAQTATTAATRARRHRSDNLSLIPGVGPSGTCTNSWSARPRAPSRSSSAFPRANRLPGALFAFTWTRSQASRHRKKVAHDLAGRPSCREGSCAQPVEILRWRLPFADVFQTPPPQRRRPLLSTAAAERSLPRDEVEALNPPARTTYEKSTAVSTKASPDSINMLDDISGPNTFSRLGVVDDVLDRDAAPPSGNAS